MLGEQRRHFTTMCVHFASEPRQRVRIRKGDVFLQFEELCSCRRDNSRHHSPHLTDMIYLNPSGLGPAPLEGRSGLLMVKRKHMSNNEFLVSTTSYGFFRPIFLSAARRYRRRDWIDFLKRCTVPSSLS